MKTLGWKRWGVGGALIGALALGGCSGMHEQTWTMSTTEKVPAAVGKVKVKNEKDGNTRVKVEVAHLAQPGVGVRGCLDLRRLAEAGHG